MKVPEVLKNVSSADDIIELPSLGRDHSFWLRLHSASGSVEGKLHLPLKNSGRLLIFEPGFPGDGSARLEKLWLIELLKNGFAVFAIRHNGTIINGKYAQTYLNCPERQKKAKREGQRLLGAKRSYSIVDWLAEPFVALEIFSPHVKEIFLVGHSFGALAVFSSLIDFYKKYSRYQNKIKGLVSLAGTTGIVRGVDDPILAQWRMYLDKSSTKARVAIGGSQKNIKILWDAYIKIHKQGKRMPKSLIPVFITPWGDTKGSTDELVHPMENIEMIMTLGRGRLVIDKTQKENEKTGRLAHDMDNLTAKTLLRLLNRRFLELPLISVVG